MSSSSPLSSRKPDDAYAEATQAFVTFWGEMASQWGINRTMAQIHARLFCADGPMNTDQIMEALSISRGNANMNLRSLTEWNLITKTRQPGSRKDFYEAETDVWRITARIIQERQRRELHPVQDKVEACRDLVDGSDGEAPSSREAMLHERLSNLIELIRVVDAVSEALLPLVQTRDEATLHQLVEMARLVAASSESSSHPPASDTSTPSSPPSSNSS